MPLHIICDLDRIEDHRHPKIGEEKDHSGIQNVMKSSRCESRRNPIRSGRSREKESQDAGGKKQDRIGKDDRHHSRVIDLKGKEGSLASINTVPAHLLGILHAHLPQGLGQGNR